MKKLGVLPEQIGTPEVKAAIDKYLQTQSKLGSSIVYRPWLII